MKTANDMTNTQKLIQAQRELIKHLTQDYCYNICEELLKKIAKLEAKIISEKTIKK